MYKKIAAVFICAFILSFTALADTGKTSKKPDDSFNDDYFVGLRAYEDGLRDIAIISLEKYLSYENKSEKAGFSLYILYQAYMAENNFKSAQSALARLQGFKDSRFDKRKMLSDQMFIEVKLDCSGAKNLLTAKPINEYMEVYVKSGCPVDKNVTDLVGKTDFSSDVLYAVLNRVKDDKELMLSTYNNLKDNKKTTKLMNFYGHYFYVNKMKPQFYALYNEYKDADLTNLVLDDVWNENNYGKYIETFNRYAKDEYSLQKQAYCRMIEASNKQTIGFDCSLVDKCIGRESAEYNKTMLACYMRKEDKDNIAKFINGLSVQETLKMCEYGKYIIGKRLYSSGFLNKFSECGDKVSMYESLLKFRDYDGMIKLRGKSDSQIDLAYSAIAYYLLGNKNEYENIMKKITDIDLSGMVRRVIQKGQA